MELTRAKKIFTDMVQGHTNCTIQEADEAMCFAIGLFNYFIENNGYYNRKVRRQLARLSPPVPPPISFTE